MSDDYERLREKVDALAAAVAEHAGAELTCRAGCAGCCRVELGVSEVEAAAVGAALDALPEAARARIAGRAADADASEGEPRCVMLEDDDRCAIHPARPLVCRTQGLPLLYPEGFVPEGAVRLRTTRGDVTVCPLNYTGRAPVVAELVDAERIDTLLALVARVDAERRGRAPGGRVPLRALASGVRVG